MSYAKDGLAFRSGLRKLSPMPSTFPMQKISRLLPLLCGVLWLLAAGCNSVTSSVTPPPPGVTPIMAQFFLEVRGGDPTTASPLPVSGMRVPIDANRPVLNRDGGDIAGVTVGRKDPEGCYMVFHLAGESAIRAFSQMTASHQGYRLVMTLNGVAFATYKIETPISNGVLAVFPEMPAAPVVLSQEETKGLTEERIDALRKQKTRLLEEKQIVDIANGINYVSGEIQRQLAQR